MSKRLEGKVAIITGGASGQGAAAVEMFVAEGAKVAAFDINEAGLQDVAARVPGVLPVTCDLADEKQVRKGIEDTVSHFGALHILYNNAGLISRKPGEWDESQDGPITDITVTEFDRNIAINLKSQFLMSKFAIPHMIAAGVGSIVNVSSTAGPIMATANTAYNTAKAGTIGLTRNIAVNYGKHNIRANTLLPGMVPTPLMTYVTENKEYIDQWCSKHPMRRMAEPRELAAVGLFLASDDASYVNGASIVADGGLTISVM